MREEFKEAFNNLSVNEKRNQINRELLIIAELIKSVETKYGISSMLKVKNYDINKNENLTETEMLSFIYEDIYNIQREFITILSAIDIKDKL